MSENLGLGKIIPDGATVERDAIHIAVAPVVAGESLDPSERVYMKWGEAWSHHPLDREKVVGIVDPFLEVSIEKGQRFWLYLFPGSITSLRHDWTHPAFVTNPELAAHLAKKKEAGGGQ